MRAAAARRPRSRPSGSWGPGVGTPPHPFWGARKSSLPATRSAPPAARLRLQEARWEGGVFRGAGPPRLPLHKLPANGSRGDGRPGGGARGASPDGTFVSARGTGGSAGRRAGEGTAAPRPAREQGGCPPVLHLRSEQSPEKWRSRSGPSPNNPRQVQAQLTSAPESARPAAPPFQRRKRAPGTMRTNKKRGRTEGRKRKGVGEGETVHLFSCFVFNLPSLLESSVSAEN